MIDRVAERRAKGCPIAAILRMRFDMNVVPFRKQIGCAIGRASIRNDDLTDHAGHTLEAVSEGFRLVLHDHGEAYGSHAFLIRHSCIDLSTGYGSTYVANSRYVALSNGLWWFVVKVGKEITSRRNLRSATGGENGLWIKNR